jgi:hypothetical protein
MTIGIDKDTAQHLAENGLNIDGTKRNEEKTNMAIEELYHAVDAEKHAEEVYNQKVAAVEAIVKQGSLNIDRRELQIAQWEMRDAAGAYVKATEQADFWREAVKKIA